MSSVLTLTKAMPTLKNSRAVATSSVSLGGDLAVLVDEPHGGQRQHGEERGEGQGHEEDLAQARGQVFAELVHPPRGRVTGEGREQHRADGYGEHPLGKLEEPERLLDDSRGGDADEGGHDGVDEGVEVDDAQAEDHRARGAPPSAPPGCASARR